MRDVNGRSHPVMADVGCRNTVFGAEAQEASLHIDDMAATPVSLISGRVRSRDRQHRSRGSTRAFTEYLAGRDSAGELNAASEADLSPGHDRRQLVRAEGLPNLAGTPVMQSITTKSGLLVRPREPNAAVPEEARYDVADPAGGLHGGRTNRRKSACVVRSRRTRTGAG